MVTRRALLKGTAAGSIAAIASAHRVAASASPIPIPYPNADSAFGAGFGNLEGGALGAFQKVPDGFRMFFKFYKTAAEVFYKEDVVLGNVDIFLKFFNKGWDAFNKYDTLAEMTLHGAAAGFYKLQSDVAGFFIKSEGGDLLHQLNVYANGETEEPDSEGPFC